MARRGTTVVKDNVSQFARAIDVLATTRVMVGVPASKDARDGETITNSEIGYLMENGIPENNVPARPHQAPGIRRAQAKINDYLKQAGRLALEGKPDSVTRAYMAAGQAGVTGIKEVIREGVPPPLADSTIRRRAAKRRGAKLEMERRARGEAPGVDLVKPLINTGQYLNAQTFVLRKISRNK